MTSSYCKQEVLGALRSVLRDAKYLWPTAMTEDHPTGGICLEVRLRCSRAESSKLFREYFKRAVPGWPEFSGVVDYPIPCPDALYGCPIDYYDWSLEYGTLWQDHGLKMRISLLEHLISFIEGEV